MRISYAQNFEDVMLLRALGHVPDGFYIDVGAQDPVQDSVSFAFYEAGWRGVHVEPVPEYARRLEEARPDERVVRAVLRGAREPMMFYGIADTGMSTGDPQIAAQHLKAGFSVSTLLVDSLPLSEILEGVGDRPIHWLKIDVEGMEQTVLESWGDSPARPWVVVVESTRPNSTETTHHEWEHIVIGLGYEFVYFDGLNRFYVSREHLELKAAFETPPNYFDDFSVTQYSFAARAPAILLHDTEIARQDAQLRAEHLSGQVEAANDQIGVLFGRIGELATDIAGLSGALAEQTAEVEAQQALAAELSAEGRQLSAERDRLSAERDQLSAKRDQLSAKRDQLLAERDRLSADRDQLSAERRELASQLASAQHANQTHHDLWQSAERTVIALRTSTSWKVSAPLRKLMASARYGARGAAAWLRFRPGSRPRRVARSVLNALGGARPAAASRPRVTETALAVGGARYVFVDHTVSCNTNTGVQRVVRGLCKAYLASGAPVRFVKWDATAGASVLINARERAWLGRWNGPPLHPSEAGVYPLEDGPTVVITPVAEPDGRVIVPEVTHMSAHGVSLTERLIAWAHNNGLTCNFVFYDAIPLNRPEFKDMAPTHAQYMRDLRMADVVLPISRWSADELCSFWSLSRDEDVAAAPAVRPLHLPAEFDRPRTADLRPDERTILCVGTVEPRKNQLALIHAFKTILAERPGCDWRLLLAGNLHPAVATQIRAETGPRSQVEFLGYVDDQQLSDLYDSCAFTAFPSTQEGFGLPVLESLWSGKPCLCADFGAVAEIAPGGGALTVDVRDPAALKAGLERLMDDAELRRMLTEEAIARPMRLWSDYVADLDRQTGPRGLIYYWVDNTITFPSNTGIQRVARQLARTLIEAGYSLVPVKWGGANQPLKPVSQEELEYFAQWNGPPPEAWTPWISPDEASGGCFIMTELPLYLTDGELKTVRGAAEQAGLKTAAIFYDTIPWKMRELYSESFANAHRTYMVELENYSLILPISHYSQHELVLFLSGECGRPRAGLGHIVACPLVGEFPELTDEALAPSPDDGIVRLLCVGTVETRKNHERLLDAFELAQRRSKSPLHLTIVGRGDCMPDLTARIRARVDASPQLEWLEQADDLQVARLYAACDFSVYPSIEEGFGLPILEGLHYGKPVVCADFGAMREVSEGGGCIGVDVRDTEVLAQAIADLADSPEERSRLAAEAKIRPVRTWSDYASDVANKLGLWTHPEAETVARHRQEMGLGGRPRLSVCISTYNRAEWLAASLRNFWELYPEPVDGVEFLVCDNASEDHTPDVVRPCLARPDFSYRRNLRNVGMLGNLRETVRAARGEYVWILGDDDLVKPGAIERVLKAIGKHPDAALVYLNYAYTRIEDARAVVDFDRFFAEATPIVPPEKDLAGPIREICARNENFFTAIYTLVFRRDHALNAYSQDTSGRPFSTMLTCIPTTHYVLNHMMDEPGVWIGEPQVVVNMNVSWMRYAPLWILERIPEVYETARAKGVAVEDIDRWRRHTLPGVAQFFAEIYGEDPLGNAAYFSPARLIGRFSDLPEFAEHRSSLMDIYARAHASGHPAASAPPEAVFGGVEQPSKRSKQVRGVAAG